MKITLRATKTPTGLKFDYSNAYNQAIKSLCVNQAVSLTIDTEPPKTSKQLAYYWGVIIETVAAEIAIKNGIKLKKDEVHNVLLDAYMNHIDVSEANKEEMEIYMNWCIEYANEVLGTTIPEPKEKE